MNAPSSNESADVLVSQEGGLGRIQLNRPKALNSLTLGMIRAITAALTAFEGNDSIAVVLVDGIGDRAFCAGGDIRALYESGKRGDADAAVFWAEEYALNAYIARYTKPYVAFMDGITMGGGVGLSAHGKHRLVTERTRLAMPETGIGFFPDVGATWLLPRAPGEVGTYIGLTGTSTGGMDAIYAGLADIEVSSDELPKIAEALSLLHPGVGYAEVRTCLLKFSLRAKESTITVLEEQRATIDKIFAFNSMPEILTALEADKSDFSRTTLKILAEKSPTSMVLTLHLLRLGRKSISLRECLDREYYGAAQIMKGVDFYEGVRAAVIDKDRKPRWQPASIAEVDEDALCQEYLQLPASKAATGAR